MKNKKRILSVGLSAMVAVLSAFGGCEDSSIPINYNPYEFPEFSTQYTEEEHIQRLSTRTEERFANYIESERLLDYQVELVYSFYNEDPEYFLIEIEYLGTDSSCQPNEFGALGFITRYAHAIGYLKKDKYYLGLNRYYARKKDSQNVLNGFIKDKSVWKIFGYNEGKKYYGSEVQAVQTDEGILQLCSGDFNPNDFDIDLRFVLTSPVFEQKIVNPNRYEQLMNTTFRLGRVEY